MAIFTKRDGLLGNGFGRERVPACPMCETPGPISTNPVLFYWIFQSDKYSFMRSPNGLDRWRRSTAGGLGRAGAKLVKRYRWWAIRRQHSGKICQGLQGVERGAHLRRRERRRMNRISRLRCCPTSTSSGGSRLWRWAHKRHLLQWQVHGTRPISISPIWSYWRQTLWSTRWGWLTWISYDSVKKILAARSEDGPPVCGRGD